MKILVLGTHGMLGRELVNSLSCKRKALELPIDVIPAGHQQVDITQRSTTTKFIAHIKPDAIVNCAAFTNVDACESHVAEAFAVNETGAETVALAGEDVGAKVIQISTDYVFDGEKKSTYIETDLTHPLSVYGKSKLKGEIAIQKVCSNYAILRTAWLYGPYRKNFVTTMLDLAKHKRSVSVVTDQHGSPTYTKDLAEAIWNVVSDNLKGLYHVTNSGTCSRFEWAKLIFTLTGKSITVLPVKTEEYKRAAVVPHNSSLDCSKYTAVSGHKMRPWQEALKDYINSME